MPKKLGFGLMRLPLIDKNNDSIIDLELTKKMVDSFIAQGFTYFDTAWMYHGGKSEEVAKECLVSRYPRESFTLTTKLPAYMIHSEEDREKVFTEQLRRTGAGYFDYYWLHDVNSHSIKTFEKYNCFDFIAEKKAAGIVKHIGFSYHDGPELLERLLTEHPEIEYVQIQLNYLDWNSLAVQSRAVYEVCEKFNKQVIVMEPVKGGTLANVPEEIESMFKAADSRMSVPSWAIRFAATRKNVFMVLSGMSNMEQLTDNTGYMNDFIPLTAEEDTMILKAAEILNRNIAIPCTGCSYCTVKCPKHIAIPNYFAIYNLEMQELKTKDWTPQGTYYDNLTSRFGKASDCIRCGQCETMCPQHLPIRDNLVKVAEKFENV